MSNPNPQDFEERIRQIEQEVYQPPLKSADPNAPTHRLQGIYAWVNSLSGVAKVVAVVVIGLVLFAIISFILNLLWGLLSLAMLIAVVYVLWKIFFAPNSSE